MASPIIGLRLSPEVLARLDAVRGSATRSVYVRTLIERDLGTVPAKVPHSRSQILNAPPKPLPKRSEKPDPLAGIPDRWAEDARLLLSIARSGPISPKRAREALGWFEGRYDRAEASLINSRQVVVVDGLLTA